MIPSALLAWPAALADLVWPRSCVGCTRPGPALCASCRGRDVVAVVDDLSVGPLPVPVVAAAAYDGGLRRALIAYKERSRHELARPLGALLRASVDFLLAAGGFGADDPLRPPPWDGVAVVPVPSAMVEARQRGGQHVTRLARAATRARAAPVIEALRVAGVAVDSSGLGLRARTAAPERFVVSRGARQCRPVVVVDDIVTSGATARDAVAALTRAGWPVVGVAVVAATPRSAPRLSPVAGRWAPVPAPVPMAMPGGG